MKQTHKTRPFLTCGLQEGLDRRHFLTSLGGTAAGMLLAQCSAAPKSTATQPPSSPSGPSPRLPWSTVFKGEAKFRELCSRAQRDNWAALPLGRRTVAAARALLGTPYGNYTLEIDNRVESPSVNLYVLDCWTFYEAALAMARMVKSKPGPWSQGDLLRFIELERYRGGRCDGTYLSRMHHLEEVFSDNERRGLGRNVTRSLGGVRIHRTVREMQIAWRDYRYLRSNPSLLSGMAKVEARVSALPVYYIPKSRVAGIESSLQDGDVLAVVGRDETAYTTHVGLAVRDGRCCRFMHATSKYDKGHRCIIDGRISSYLNEGRSHIGLIVFRPGEAPSAA